MKGELALPAITEPSGVAVRLSGWDLGSWTTTSAAIAAAEKPVTAQRQAAKRIAFERRRMITPRNWLPGRSIDAGKSAGQGVRTYKVAMAKAALALGKVRD